MKKAEAEETIIAEWHRWIADNKMRNPTSQDASSFFWSHLNQNCPHLLRFRSRPDKWQVVHGWLLRRRLVSDLPRM